MATHNKTLQLIASKLGLADEDRVLRKAAEYQRLLQTKTTAGSNMSDTSKVVICLDLAAFVLGVDMDTKTAIKYSGLKSSTYTNSRKVVENLLELNSDRITVPGVCVKLQCTGVQALAENILGEYRKHAKMDIDLNLPQYVCMAVHQACRLNKVKISKAKLLETSRLRPAQWAKLEADWTKFANEKFAAAKKRGRSVKNTVVSDEMEIDKPPREELVPEPQTESYEDWKRRILQTAYKELRELGESQKQQTKKQKIDKVEESRRSPRKHSLSLSRSPRKNSQLMSPNRSLDSTRRGLLSPSKDQLSSTLDGHNMSVGKISQSLKENQWSPKKIDVMSPMQIDMSPRRSPRKTPQKFSPFSSPGSMKGVRLLFPKNL